MAGSSPTATAKRASGCGAATASVGAPGPGTPGLLLGAGAETLLQRIPHMNSHHPAPLPLPPLAQHLVGLALSTAGGRREPVRGRGCHKAEEVDFRCDRREKSSTRFRHLRHLCHTGTDIRAGKGFEAQWRGFRVPQLTVHPQKPSNYLDFPSYPRPSPSPSLPPFLPACPPSLSPSFSLARPLPPSLPRSLSPLPLPPS